MDEEECGPRPSGPAPLVWPVRGTWDWARGRTCFGVRLLYCVSPCRQMSTGARTSGDPPPPLFWGSGLHP